MSHELVEVKKRKREWAMPGDVVIKLRPGAVVSVGRGLRQDLTKITAIRCGQYDEHNEKHLVIGDEKAYIPRNEDIVIGIVAKGSSYTGSYYLDAGAGDMVKLGAESFDGASKRIKPDLKIGSTVYARMVQARSEIEMEASCCSVTGVKKDWVTGESLFGELKGGYVHNIRPIFARHLLADTNQLLTKLGERVAFECCIGVNGRVWLRGRTTTTTQLLARCITELQRNTLPDGEALQTIDEILDDFFPIAKTRPKAESEEDV
eukprot:TRINITY_DN30326_c0_g1_i1.p1 TRINITY_DN30326_c0_g1~~TRINITY_DN30326_c0_g1_i1.p1  ORF type:complete len:288 (+),score=83.61 TRINITY_DN30326_c0_g1_i1:80-865(+)